MSKYFSWGALLGLSVMSVSFSGASQPKAGPRTDEFQCVSKGRKVLIRHGSTEQKDGPSIDHEVTLNILPIKGRPGISGEMHVHKNGWEFQAGTDRFVYNRPGNAGNSATLKMIYSDGVAKENFQCKLRETQRPKGK
jgi:hypothetical protein